MSGARRVLITLIISSLTCAVFAAVAHFGLLSVIEDKFYKPMVYSRLEERNDLLSETVGKYIDTQDALFTLFAANPEIRVIAQKEQDEMLVKSRANLASDLLTETPGLEGLRIIGKNGKTIYYSTFPQDFAARKDDEPASYRNYPKNDIPFEDIAASEEDKSRILHDSENNRLIFSYPFYDNEMAFVGTVAFYVDAPSMLRYFIPTDRLSAQSGIYLWGTQKEDIHGFVFSVPEGLETVCKNAAVSSWNSSQKIYAFEDPESIGNRAKYLLVSAENKSGFVSTVFKEDILYMPERIRNIIVLATISLIFFISIICCIAKNAAEKHAERPSLAKEDKMLAAEAASEVSIRAEEPKKDESLIEKIDDVFEMLAAESVPAEKPKHTEIAEVAEENAEPQFDYDSQEFGDTLFEDSLETEEAPESANGADETADELFDEIYNEEIQSEQAAQLEAGAQAAPEAEAQFADDAQLEAGAQLALEAEPQFADDAQLEAGAQPAPLQLEDDSPFADDAAQIEADAQLAQPAALEEEAEQLEIEIPAFDESEFEETDNIQAEPADAQPIPTESTAAFLSAIDERMHQRQEIIEEYTQPVLKPHLEESEADESVTTTIDENFEIEIPQFDADYDILENAETVPEPSEVSKEAQPEIRHGLLSAGNAILADGQKKEQMQQEEKVEQPQQEIKSAPLRKSSLSSIFKEKVQQNQPYAEKQGGHSGLHNFVQQTAPSTELTDISQHGLLFRGDDYRSNLPQKPALYTLDLKNSRRNQNAVNQNTQNAVEQQKEKKMDTSLYDETLEELQPAVETETVTSIFALQSAPQLFAAFANKEPEQRGSFERKGIADRIVESTTAKMTPVFTEPEHKIDNIHIENGVYRIHEEKDAVSNVKINYDFKRLVDSVLNG